MNDVPQNPGMPALEGILAEAKLILSFPFLDKAPEVGRDKQTHSQNVGYITLLNSFPFEDHPDLHT